MLVLQVVPQCLPRDRNCCHFFRTRQSKDVSKSLPLQSSDRPTKLLRLVSHNMRSELPIRPTLVTLLTKPFRHIQHNRYRQHVKLTSESNQRLTRLWLYVGRIHNSQPTSSEPFTRNVMQHVEGVV